MPLRSGLLAVLAFLLVPCAVAAAASPPGTLAQIAGVGGCVSLQTTLGCTAARGLDDARAVAVSPDGKSLYAVASTPAAITAFNVDPRNGLLAQLTLGAGCLTSIPQPDCGSARALEGATAVAVSPDGLHVYVASASAGAVASFARQPNGSLVQLVGIAGCVTTTLTNGCATAPALAGADAIAISPDGRFVYVAASSADAITIFTRDATTGRITPVPGAAGCLRANRTGCTPVSGVDAPSALAMAPDGASLYATSSVGTLTAFKRDVATGALAQLAPGAGCLSDAPNGDCTAIGGLARASAVAVSPDGATVVTAALDSDTVLTFRRDPATSALTRIGCVSGNTGLVGCTPSGLMGGPRGLAIRSDSRIVWVASSRGDGIITLQLDPATSALLPTAGAGGCLRRQASVECRAARALDDPRGLAVAPGGLHVFAVSALSDGIAVLGPQLAPNCLATRASTVANKARSVVLACSDPNGDKVELTIVKRPTHGRIGPLAKATGTVLYTPQPGYTGADAFTFRATDGMDVSANGTATVRVTLPTKAPAVRIRTARARLLPGSKIHVLVECPAIAIGPCRIATHLVVKGKAAGYGFARLGRRTTGRIVLRADGVTGRTKAQVVVTVRDKTRRATISRRTIVIVP